jgi:PAS domain S-box-containing protein
MKYKILYIDDDLAMHYLIKTFLEKHDHECFCASNGQQGLELLLKIAPDLILLDYILPGMDGEKIYQEIVSNPLYDKFKNTPVIIITAKQSDHRVKAKFLEGGVSAFLQKPFGLQELTNVIENVFINHEIRLNNLRLQNEIKQTRDYLESLFNSLPIGIVSTDQYGTIKRVNSYLIQLLEFEHEKSILGKNLLRDDLFNCAPSFQKILKDGVTLAIERTNYISKNSNRISLKLRGVPLQTQNRINGLILTVQDITEAERKEQELAIIAQIGQFMHGTLHLDQMLHLILTAITAGCALGFSRAMILLVNGKKKVLEGRMGVGPGSLEDAIRIWNSLAEENISLPGFLNKYGFEFSRDDIAVNQIVKQIKIPLGQKNCIFTKILAEKKPVKANFKEMDIENCPTFKNELGLEEFLAVPLIAKDKVIGIIVADNHFSNRLIDNNMSELLMIFANQAGLAIERAEGYENLAAEKDKLEQAYQELKQTQERLLHSERLATVGKMAAEVAHEIRNPLVAVGGFARNILKLAQSSSTEEKLISYSNIIVDEVNRLENIITNVLDYTRLSRPDFHLEDINEIIQNVCLFISVQEDISTKGISIQQQLDHSLPKTLLDSQQIKQVLLNVCQNAIHSMSNGGELTIVSRYNDKKNQLVIEIHDTGVGMSPKILEEMFNPFFTTKEDGTGLGLSISQQIIHNHNGHIDVNSEVGKGSTFFITLQITDDMSTFEKSSVITQPEPAYIKA